MVLGGARRVWRDTIGQRRRRGEAGATGIFTGCRRGKLDRSQLTALCDGYLRRRRGRICSSLKTWRPPTVQAGIERKRGWGGMTFGGLKTLAFRGCSES